MLSFCEHLIVSSAEFENTELDRVGALPACSILTICFAIWESGVGWEDGGGERVKGAVWLKHRT